MKMVMAVSALFFSVTAMAATPVCDKLESVLRGRTQYAGTLQKWVCGPTFSSEEGNPKPVQGCMIRYMKEGLTQGVAYADDANDVQVPDLSLQGGEWSGYEYSGTAWCGGDIKTYTRVKFVGGRTQTIRVERARGYDNFVCANKVYYNYSAACQEVR